MARHRETRTKHQYLAYGMLLDGYGSSMDSHRCGDEDEPCWTITETREVTVTDWKVSETKSVGKVPGYIQKIIDGHGEDRD